MVTEPAASTDMLADALVARVRAAEDTYYRLVVLAGPPRSGKVRALRRVAERTGGRLLNLNLKLSQRLLDLDLTAKQRALRLPKVLDDILDEYGSPVLLCHIEILFDPGFRQDSLRLLQQLSRGRTVVVAWNGAAEGGFLTYGEPGHHEYQRHPTEELALVEIEPTTADQLQ